MCTVSLNCEFVVQTSGNRFELNVSSEKYLFYTLVEREKIKFIAPIGLVYPGKPTVFSPKLAPNKRHFCCV